MSLTTKVILETNSLILPQCVFHNDDGVVMQMIKRLYEF